MSKTKTIAVCASEGCANLQHARRLCKRHHHEAVLLGEIGGYDRKRTDPVERFFSKVDAAGPCWEWRGTLNSQGYGRFYAGPSGSRAEMYAHRWAWEHLVGPILDGLTLDHLCRNPICVNPDHLEPVTNSENVRRQMFKRTWCVSGRHLLEETGIVRPNGKRYCGECGRERSRTYHQMHLEKRRAYGRRHRADQAAQQLALSEVAA